MLIREFLIWLLLISLGCIGIIYGASNLMNLSGSPLFYIISVACFFAFNLVVYALALYTSASSNLFSFNNTVIISFVAKILMALVLLLSFEKAFGRIATSQALIFLFIYIVFTVFEVIYLMKLARMSSKQ